MSAAPVLALPWRLFPLSVSGGELTIRGLPVVIAERPNSDQGTGHAVWDGSIILAKFLERRGMRPKEVVLELGSGTGLVGICCAVLGAERVILTDLEYCLDNARANIAQNQHYFPQGVRCEAECLDWYKPLDAMKWDKIDVVVMADVVWIEPLVVPLATTIAALHSKYGCEMFIAHQTRSRAVDSLFFGAVERHGLHCVPIGKDDYHEQFRHPALTIYAIKPMHP